MKVVILLGGTGTRLKEMTEYIPKGLIPIGGIPMVVHIMRWYAKFGFKDFVLALGYKQEAFKQYFAHYAIINNDIHVKTGHGPNNVSCWGDVSPWDVTLSDTGENTMKGARLKRVEKYIEDETFFCSYGDGLADINLHELLAFHKKHGKIATVTGVHSPPRFGEIHRKDGTVISFSEKPVDDNHLINGGYFVFNRKIFDYLSEDSWCDLEVGALELIAAKGEMMVYHHRGWWGCMDNLLEMSKLSELWNSGKAPWKVQNNS
jgi:glucose-1-phosphate cytidylyltransferase